MSRTVRRRSWTLQHTLFGTLQYLRGNERPRNWVMLMVGLSGAYGEGKWDREYSELRLYKACVVTYYTGRRASCTSVFVPLLWMRWAFVDRSCILTHACLAY